MDGWPCRRRPCRYGPVTRSTRRRTAGDGSGSASRLRPGPGGGAGARGLRPSPLCPGQGRHGIVINTMRTSTTRIHRRRVWADDDAGSAAHPVRAGRAAPPTGPTCRGHSCARAGCLGTRTRCYAEAQCRTEDAPRSTTMGAGRRRLLVGDAGPPKAPSALRHTTRWSGVTRFMPASIDRCPQRTLGTRWAGSYQVLTSVRM